MILSERDFLKQLEHKAEEQRKLAGTEILPGWAVGVGEWLVVNPWRVLVPLSVIIYVGLRLIAGSVTREVVLGLFGGFRL